MDAVWYDEAKDISSHTLDAMSYAMQPALFPDAFPAKFVAPALKPLDIHCKACGADPGQRCTKAHRRHGKTGYRGYHFRRKDDARLATEAVRALNSGLIAPPPPSWHNKVSADSWGAMPVSEEAHGVRLDRVETEVSTIRTEMGGIKNKMTA
jgi:hypothetical protein